MKRQTAMTAFAGLTLLLMISPAVPGAGGQTGNDLPLNTRRLSDKVLVAWVGDHTQTIDVVALSTLRSIVVIETNLIRSADIRIRRAIERTFGRSDVKYLINTHHHHDHTAGNQVYADACIVAHKAVLAGMKAELTGEGLTKLVEKFKTMSKEWADRLAGAAPDSREYNFFREGIILLKAAIEEFEDGFTSAFPSVLFEKSLTLDMGDTTLELYSFAGLHTPSDIVVFVPMRLRNAEACDICGVDAGILRAAL
jgi:glyoxylase-like metal-dependent hydrolase (beta-lactamase superfamily II)